MDWSSSITTFAEAGDLWKYPVLGFYHSSNVIIRGLSITYSSGTLDDIHRQGNPPSKLRFPQFLTIILSCSNSDMISGDAFKLDNTTNFVIENCTAKDIGHFFGFFDVVTNVTVRRVAVEDVGMYFGAFLYSFYFVFTVPSFSAFFGINFVRAICRYESVGRRYAIFETLPNCLSFAISVSSY